MVADQPDEVPLRDSIAVAHSQSRGLHLELVESEFGDGLHHRRGIVLHAVLLDGCLDLLVGPPVVD